MSKHELLPFQYNGWDGDQEIFQFYEAQFFDNWGPFVKGQIVDCLVVAYVDGEVYHLDESGNKLDSVKVKLTVIE